MKSPAAIVVRLRPSMDITPDEADTRLAEALLRLHNRRRELIAAGILTDESAPGEASITADQKPVDIETGAPIDRTVVSASTF